MQKEQKKMQLCMLLVNKFRNKFQVNNVSEPAVDQIIKDQINELLSESAMYESKLNQIDKRLELLIKDARAESKQGNYNTISKPVGKSNDLDMDDVYSDAKSQKSLRSQIQSGLQSAASKRSQARSMISKAGSSIVNGGQYQNSHCVEMDNGRMAIMDDPAAALNMTDRRWNAQVQENVRKMHEENDRKERLKKEKNHHIWEEQKKQIEAKRKVEREEKLKDRQFYDEIGCKSSDIYYINEDKKVAYINSLRGNAGKMAQHLREKHNKMLAEKRENILRQNEARGEQTKKIQEEDAIAK